MSPHNCNNGGDSQAVCVETSHPNYTRQCSTGYTVNAHNECDDFDACEGNPCKNDGDIGASCQDEIAPSLQYTCSCSAGYESVGGPCRKITSPSPPSPPLPPPALPIAATSASGCKLH